MTRLAALVACLVCLTGCGGSGHNTVSVSGTLTWSDGTPITGATIMFMPKDEKVGRQATGLSGSDGKFQLTTFNQNDGAVPADYHVVVTKPTKAATEGSEVVGNPTEAMKKALKKAKAAEKSEIPAVYGSPKTTNLKWKIEGSTSEVNLKLQKL